MSGASGDIRDGSTRLEQALTRIDRSRARLRTALLPTPEPDEGRQPGSPAGSGRMLRRWRAALRRWLAGTPLAPLAHVARPAWAAAGAWWQQHPWRATGIAAGRAVSEELAPVVRRHPVLSVSLAAAAGAAVVAARPWRWEPLASHAQQASRRAIDSTLSWSWQQLSQPSVQVALATALAAWSGQQAQSAAAPQPSAAPEATPEVADHPSTS
jgi:hypothetical protein